MSALGHRIDKAVGLFRPGGLCPDQLDLAKAIDEPDRRGQRLREIYFMLDQTQTELACSVNQHFVAKLWRELMPVIHEARSSSEQVGEWARRITSQFNDSIGPNFDQVTGRIAEAKNEIQQLL